MQFAALFVVIGALVSDNRDGKFIWLSLGIMTVSLIGRIIMTYFSTRDSCVCWRTPLSAADLRSASSAAAR